MRAKVGTKQKQAGVYLASLWKRRDCKREAFALHSGIDHTTLWRWEQGEVQPTATLARKALDALNATPRERLVVYDLLPTTSGLAALRSFAEVRSPGLGSLAPATGDVIKALYLKQGLSQAAAASRIGVSASRLCRWESGSANPDQDMVMRIVATFDGTIEEQRLLLDAKPSIPPGTLDRASLEELVNAVDHLRELTRRGDSGLADLIFRRVEAALWRHAVRRPESGAITVLANAMASHGNWLDRGGRRRELAPITHRLLTHLMPKQRIPPSEEWWMEAVLHQVRVWRFATHFPGGKTEADARAMTLLRRYLDAATSDVMRCGILRDIAEVAGSSGLYDVGLRAIEEAQELARRNADYGLTVLCAGIKAHILERIGQETGDRSMLALALETVPTLDDARDDVSVRAGWAIARSGLLYQNGFPAEGEKHLTIARELMEQHDFTHLRPSIDNLTNRYL